MGPVLICESWKVVRVGKSISPALPYKMEDAEIECTQLWREWSSESG